MGLFRKKRKVNEEIPLGAGIVMREPLTMQTSSWLKNCMAKCVLVFSIIFGTLGCFLSCYKIEFYVLPTAGIMFLMALLFTSIYFRGWLMDAVYIVFFVVFVLLLRMFRTYVNSGFYVIINAVLEKIQDYYELPGMQFYEVAEENETLAVTMSVIFIGTVAMIVANVILSRTMNAWFLLIMTAWIFVLPLFFRLEPDSFYVVLMMTGYISVWAIHSSGAYGMDRKHRDYKWKDRKRKGLRFWYMQDATTMLETLALFLVMIIVIYGITSMVQDKKTFNIRYNQNPLKESAEKEVQIWVTRSSNWRNNYDATGGVNEGMLGGIDSVNSDYQTDLIVTFAPYTYSPIYLKSYTGIYYDSEASRWFDTPYNPDKSTDTASDYDCLDQTIYSAKEAELLAYNYQQDKGVHSARAIMLVQNIGANRNYPFSPYYHFTNTTQQIDEKQTASIIYQPSYREEDSIHATGQGINLPYVELGETLAGTKIDKRVAWGDQTTTMGYCDILGGELGNGPYAEYEFYPLIQDTEDIEGQVTDAQIARAEAICLQVPEQCRDAVSRACAEAGITGQDSEEEIVAKIQTYLGEEFSYTLRPKVTPEGEDFISYFLQNKKGFCVHFSSTATMMLRYCGIPARYTEGYVITFDDLMAGDLNEDYSYEEFYQGYNPLGETAVLDVEISDTRGHAWVEYFDHKVGWRQLEVTTAAVELEEEEDSFWDAFGTVGDNQNNTFDLGNGLTLPTVDLNLDDLRGIWITVLLVIVSIILFWTGRRIFYAIREYRTWHTKDAQENVLAYYHVISERLRKKDPLYRECPTYQTQLAYMQKHCKEWNWDDKQLAELLERAGYSKQGIDEFSCRRLMLELADIDKKVRNWKRYRK